MAKEANNNANLQKMMAGLSLESLIKQAGGSVPPEMIRSLNAALQKIALLSAARALQCTSVAVADDPAGPFSYYGCVSHPDGKPWGEKKGDSFIFDPGVLVDDDGKAYLYAGFAPLGFMRSVFRMRGNRVDGSVCLELEDDMITR